MPKREPHASESWRVFRILSEFVDGFGTAVIGAVIVSIVSFVLNAFVPDRRRSRRRG